MLGCGFVVLPNEQLLSGVSLPTVWAVECGDELAGGFAGKIGGRFCLCSDRVNPVYPATVRPGTKVDPFFYVVGNPLRVLEHEAVKVGDPERPVRPGPEGDWAEPRITRGQEFRPVGALGTAAGEADPAWL